MRYGFFLLRDFMRMRTKDLDMVMEIEGRLDGYRTQTFSDYFVI